MNFNINQPTEEELLNIPFTRQELYDSITEDVIKFIKYPKSKDFTHSKKLRVKIFNQIVNNLFTSGKVNKDELKDDRVIKTKVLAYLNKKGLKIITTYRESLLLQAEHFHEVEKINYAIVFYAMYFEHTINYIIKRASLSMGLQEKLVNEIIRNTNINSKFTWLLRLLHLKTFNGDHLKVILNVAEKRNSIIHYKWNETLENDLTGKKQKQESLIFQKSVQLAIKYIKSYESITIYKKEKGVIHKYYPIN